MKKTAKYDDEELEILQAWEAGTLKPVSDMAEQAKAHRAAADATFKKDQRLNIRISRRLIATIALFARVTPFWLTVKCARNRLNNSLPEARLRQYREFLG
jgi:predicted DNA binding CopG/RHH family protein